MGCCSLGHHSSRNCGFHYAPPVYDTHVARSAMRASLPIARHDVPQSVVGFVLDKELALPAREPHATLFRKLCALVCQRSSSAAVHGGSTPPGPP
eukprot:71821-Amphidinium_carterae.1